MEYTIKQSIITTKNTLEAANTPKTARNLENPEAARPENGILCL